MTRPPTSPADDRQRPCDGAPTRPPGGSDRGVSTIVNYVLAIAIVTILLSGLTIGVGGFLDDERERTTRAELEATGGELASELSAASRLAADGATVDATVTRPERVTGGQYNASLVDGCSASAVGYCVRMATADGDLSVTVPVHNETPVEFDRDGDEWTVTANGSGMAETGALGSRVEINVDPNIGVGEGVDEERGVGDTVVVNRPPVSGFTYAPGRPTFGEQVRFENDTDDLDGTITSYKWDFQNDGTIDATGPTVNHTYPVPGQYEARLMVTDDDGERDNATKLVTVNGLVYQNDAVAVNASGDPRRGGVTFGVVNEFNASARGVGSVSDAEVTVTDVRIDPENASIQELREENDRHEVEFSGDDDAYVDGDSGFGVSGDGVILNFQTSGDNQDGPGRLDSSRYGSFGFYEFEPSLDMAGENLTVGVSYRVNGSSYSARYDVVPAVPSADLTAAFSVTPDPVVEGEDATFDASASEDTDGSIVSYEWDFGNGQTATTASPTVTYPYTAPGTYDVTLTVTGSDGGTDTVGKTVRVVDDDPGGTVLAVNAGGASYTASDGTTYRADDGDGYYAAGNCYPNDCTSGTISQSIDNTSDDFLYQSERFGDPVEYGVEVPDGEYEVTLKFAEIYWDVPGGESGGGGSRVFDVEIEGTTRTDDLDIHESVGSLHALDRTYTVTVSDGDLNVSLPASTDNGKLAALRVESTSATGNYQEGTESDGDAYVAIEAENFSDSEPGTAANPAGDDMTGTSWTPFADGDASDGEAMRAEPHPDSQERNALDTRNGPRLDYEVDFDTTGTYYVWVRMEGPSGEDDSIHVGLDGQPASFDSGFGFGTQTGSDWEWTEDESDGPTTVQVDSTGTHTVHVWMRETGAAVDKIYITQDPGAVPTGDGPATSPRWSLRPGPVVATTGTGPGTVPAPRAGRTETLRAEVRQ